MSTVESFPIENDEHLRWGFFFGDRIWSEAGTPDKAGDDLREHLLDAGEDGRPAVFSVDVGQSLAS